MIRSNNPVYQYGWLLGLLEARYGLDRFMHNVTYTSLFYSNAPAALAAIKRITLATKPKAKQDREIMGLFQSLTERFPKRIPLAEQGFADLGYYRALFPTLKGDSVDA